MRYSRGTYFKDCVFGGLRHDTVSKIRVCGLSMIIDSHLRHWISIRISRGAIKGRSLLSANHRWDGSKGRSRRRRQNGRCSSRCITGRQRGRQMFALRVVRCIIGKGRRERGITGHRVHWGNEWRRKRGWTRVLWILLKQLAIMHWPWR
jgi:hypothetical protein